MLQTRLNEQSEAPFSGDQRRGMGMRCGRRMRRGNADRSKYFIADQQYNDMGHGPKKTVARGADQRCVP